MVRGGLKEEFDALLENGYGENSPGMHCVGYKELFANEKKEMSFKAAVDAIKQNSRNYAKRQITWFKHQVQCIELDMQQSPLHNAEKRIVDFFGGK
jgi:tRNA dimethylallyltransferase